MKKFRQLLFIFLGCSFVIIFPSFFKATGKNFAVNQNAPRISPLNLREEIDVAANFWGAPASIPESRTAQPLSLAAADFDQDGMPDLIAGYGNGEQGVIAVYRGNVDLLFPKSERGESAPPFQALAKTFNVPVRADLIGAGDFDADGHWDLVAAARGGNQLFLLKGDGSGNFPIVLEKTLAGSVTALATGEINRRDGLQEIAVGLFGDKPEALIFESPDGAFNAQPEIFELPGKASSFAFGEFDEADETDLAVASGKHLVIIHGRDRRLSLDKSRQHEIGKAKLSQEELDFEIKSITAGKFISDKTDLALLSDNHTVHFFKRLETNNWQKTESFRLPADSPDGDSTVLIKAKISGYETDDLIALDRDNRKLRFINTRSAEKEIRALNTENAPVAALPMRLNKDGLADLVILREGENLPSVVLTAPTAVFVVNSTGNQGDNAGCDGACAVDCVRDQNGGCVLDGNNCPVPAGACTFRAAREQANYCPPGGPNPCGRNDEIRFALPGAEPFLIDWYPVNMNMSVTIDGYTQAGASPNTLPNGDNAVVKVQIKGPGNGIGTAVAFNGSNSVVRGLAFSDFCGRAAIGLGGGGGHIVEGNFTGTDTGAVAHVGCNGSQGIQVASPNNRVGGTTPQARNLFTDNGVGVDFFGGSNTLVQGNFIGTDRTGTNALGGSGHGVNVNPGANNTIGGTEAGARNIISGHNADVGFGILVQGTNANLIQGNYIGLDVTGARALRNNSHGIETRADNVTIGGTTPAARNVISANGGATNSGDGVIVVASNVLVQGNFIGTDATGTIVNPDGVPSNGDELGNRRVGVFTCDGPSCGGISNITIGGSQPGARNIISGNVSHGVVLGAANPNGANHLVLGNYIGTDVTGTLARGNGGDGVFDASMGSTIGGNQTGAGNVISGNSGNGIQIAGFRNSRVEGNFIGLRSDGVSPLGNGQHGVFANGSHGATIGGTAADAGNRIAFNGGDGVRFIGFQRQTAILGNSIYSNNAVGIELLDSANNNQAAPVLTSVSQNGANAVIGGTLTSAPNTAFRLEFFANSICDPSGAGEGETLIGSTNATTNASGVANFSANLSFMLAANRFVTVTATNPAGMTSKFSACRRIIPKQFDFDGDGRADISVFRPSNAIWYLLRSTAGFTGIQFGVSTDKIAPADFDGDGRTDIAVFRDGNWFWLQSSNGAFRAVQFGAPGDVPLPGDYDDDGDARADLAVFRQGNWFFLDSLTNQFRAVQFGISTDKAVPADFDGDGRTDPAVFRDGNWYWLQSTNNQFRALQFGIASDKPLVGDFDGDGRFDQTVYRNGIWYLNRSTAGFTGIQFGISSDTPAPADFDGDGRTDLAVYRDGTWYLQQSTAGFQATQFGVIGDKPIPAAFLP